MDAKLRGALLGAILTATLAVVAAALAVWKNDALQDERIARLTQELSNAQAEMRATTAELRQALRELDNQERGSEWYYHGRWRDPVLPRREGDSR